MSYLEIILPFGIPPAPLAKELLRQAEVPYLHRLLCYAKKQETVKFNEFARLLPHEYWTYQRQTIDQIPPAPSLQQRYTSPSISLSLMAKMGVAPPTSGESSIWFTVNPVHIHVARDHLVMTDPRRLSISNEESQQLFKLAQALCIEAGHELIYGDTKTWFLRADAWADLITTSIDAAAGHNMDIWLPDGECARAWRKLQNEIQMAWHIDRVNQERETIGQVSINSLWIHGGSARAHPITVQNSITGFKEKLESLNDPDNKLLFVADELIEAALNNDWGAWLQQFNQLEVSCFAPLVQALDSGTLKSANLVLSDAQQLYSFACRERSAWKFWKKADQSTLLGLSI